MKDEDLNEEEDLKEVPGDLKIIFDDKTDNIVDLFVNAGISCFQILQNANPKTRETMQQFLDNLGLNESQIPMFIRWDDTTVLKPNDNLEITFGGHDTIAKPSHCFISINKTTGDFISTSKITAYPFSNPKYYPKNNIEDPDYVEISSSKVESSSLQSMENMGIQKTVAFNIFSNGEVVPTELNKSLVEESATEKAIPNEANQGIEE